MKIRRLRTRYDGAPSWYLRLAPFEVWPDHRAFAHRFPVGFFASTLSDSHLPARPGFRGNTRGSMAMETPCASV